MRNLDEKKAAPAESEREQPMEERLKEVEKRLSWTSWAIVILGALNTINCLYLGRRWAHGKSRHCTRDAHRQTGLISKERQRG